MPRRASGTTGIEMDGRIGPLLTSETCDALRAAARDGVTCLRCSLDLGLSTIDVAVDGQGWEAAGRRFPHPRKYRERTIYHWREESGTFEPLARYTTALVKLVPTPWGAPTFEIDGIKMLPTAQVSPFEDAARKVRLVGPQGRVVLDTCAGLGYFAHWCLAEGAAQVLSFEKSADVLWLREHNPWSPGPDPRLVLRHEDITRAIGALPTGSIDACLHDPPRFGIAGELYSQSFYDELARVMRRGGRLFHYTGTPNRLTTGRDVPREVAVRLRRAGFQAELQGDGVLARLK